MIHQARFSDTVAELFSQEQAGVCKTVEIDLHLGFIAKGYGFGLKDMNIFRRQPVEIYWMKDVEQVKKEEEVEYVCRIPYPLSC